MMNLAQIAAALGGVVAGGQVLAPAPGHSPADRGMSIKLNDAGDDIVVHLFNGGDPLIAKDEARGKLGIERPGRKRRDGNGHARPNDEIDAILAGDTAPPPPRGKPDCFYDYRDQAGKPVYRVERYSKPTKEFRQCRHDGNGGFIRTKVFDGVERVPYHLPELVSELAAFPLSAVLITEGEKDCDNVRRLGIIATCAAGNVWTPGMAKVLAGRFVYILADNDDAGKGHATRAATALYGLAHGIHIVEFPDLAKGGDVSDWLAIEGNGSSDALLRYCSGTPAFDPAAEPVAPADKVVADASASMVATPYVWKDPATIPRREWLYGHLLVRKFVSATVSPGGFGKSSLIAAEAMAMVSGKNLLGSFPAGPLRVWLWNLEDPQVETERKIQAVALQYQLSRSDLGNDRLFVDSGRDKPLVIATTTRTGAMIVRPVVEAFIAEIINRGIDVVIIDPFVSCHEVPENDNTAQDMVIKEWGRVADRGNCAIHLVDHTRKMGGDVEVTVEASRGAKAKTDACRVVRVVNRMSKEEGARAGIENHRLYFRVFNDKANLQPPADSSDWFKLKSVELGNGDNIGVPVRWEWPDPLAGMTGADFDKAAIKIRAGKWRASPQANDWVGKPVADALRLDLNNRADKAKVAGMIKVWLSVGSLVEVDGEDAKRMPRKFVEVRADP